MKLFKKNTKAEEYFIDKIDNIEQETNKIFYEVIDNFPIHQERLELMLKKVLLLKTYVGNIGNDMESHNEENILKSKKYWMFGKVALIAALLTSFFNFSLTIACHIVYIIFTFLEIKGYNKMISEATIKEVEEQTCKLKNTLTSSYNFITKRMQTKNIEVTEIQSEELSYEHCVSYIIDVYFKTGEIVDMTMNLKNYVVTFLQRSMGTTENNLETLLDLMKNKQESTEEMLTLTRKDNNLK